MNSMFLSVLPANHFYHIFYYVQSVVATTYILIFFTMLFPLQVLNSFTPVFIWFGKWQSWALLSV